VTKNIVTLIKNQIQILYVELPAFASSRYLVAQLDFNQNNAINDTHVYTNNPNFQTNSNQLIIPCEYTVRGCEVGTSRNEICNLPFALCNNINDIKIIEFNFGFPYWSNTFSNNHVDMVVRISNANGFLFPLTNFHNAINPYPITSIGLNNNPTLNTRTEKIHLIDRVTANIEVFNEFIVQNV
jgi:hypothetical protein